MKTTAENDSTPQAPIGFDLAAPVSVQVEVQAVNLIESTVRRSPGKDIPREIEYRFQVRTSVDEHSNSIYVYPRFQVISGQQKGNTAFLFIEAEFQLVYSLKSRDGLRTENFEAFGRLNGIFNCWPYWREYVQQTTTRMGLPPLTLPVYRPDRAVPAATKLIAKTKARKKLK